MDGFKNFPFDVKAATKDMNKTFRELLGSSGDMVNALIKMQAIGWRQTSVKRPAMIALRKRT